MKQTLKYIYDKLLDQMRYAEAKHSVSIALASALVVFSATFLQSVSILITTLTAGSIVLALISVLYSFIALSARKIRINRRLPKLKDKNLMYYKNIIQFDEHSYVDEIKRTYNLPNNYVPDDMDYDLAKNIISTAKVTSLKFSYFNLSLVFLYLSLLCEVLVIILMGGV